MKKKISTMSKKINELEKVALSLLQEEKLERFSCKRNIKQNNMQAAIPKAKRCIELRKKSQAYLSLCQRIRIFIEQVELSIDKYDKTSKDLHQLVDLVANGVDVMNLGLIELYLEAFEKKFHEKIKDQMKEVNVMSYMDAFRNVLQPEIDDFIREMRIEAKEDEKAFMFKKGSLVKDIVM